MVVYLDLETRSGLDIRKSNVYRYVEDPDFAVLMMAYAVGDEPVQLSTDTEEISRLVRHWLKTDVLVAHNAAFDRIALSALLGEKKYLDPGNWLDPAVHAAELGYPRALGKLAKELKVGAKDTAGTSLINWFCKPTKEGSFRSPEDHPEKWEQFCSYCRTDVEVMRQCCDPLNGVTEFEDQLWVVSERINDRGMPIDVEQAEKAAAAVVNNTAKAKQRVSELLDIDNPGSVQQLTAGLAETGLKVPNLRAETVEKLLLTDLTDVQREALELRQDLSGSASKKFQAALNGVCVDGRIRGSFKFYGASTGRYSGSGCQPQNLPRAALKPTKVEIADLMLENDLSEDEAAVEATDTLNEEAVTELKRSGEADPATLKALVRPLFTGPMTVCDYSSIEARVLAWLAGETWALEAFKAGRDIYTETAKRMGPGFTRQQGKAATLGLGYNGSVRALRNVGMEGTDDELKPLVVTWRQANQRIVQFWDDLFDAWVYGGAVGPITIKKNTGTREMVLPSGRSIWYRGVRWEKYIVEDDEGNKSQKEGWRYNRSSGGRVRLWAGLAVENIVQGVARDLLGHALVELENEGLPVIAHVHDEVLVEGVHRVEDLAEIMCRKPKWARGLPVDAAGFTSRRYQKG